MGGARGRGPLPRGGAALIFFPKLAAELRNVLEKESRLQHSPVPACPWLTWNSTGGWGIASRAFPQLLALASTSWPRNFVYCLLFIRSRQAYFCLRKRVLHLVASALVYPYQEMVFASLGNSERQCPVPVPTFFFFK